MEQRQQMMEAVIFIAMFIVLVWLVLRYSLGLWYGYRIGEQGIEIRLFQKFKIWSIPFNEIVDIRHSRIGGSEIAKDFYNPFIWLRLGNKLTVDVVLITKKSGIKKIVITPDRPYEFVKNVQQFL